MVSPFLGDTGLMLDITVLLKRMKNALKSIWHCVIVLIFILVVLASVLVFVSIGPILGVFLGFYMAYLVAKDIPKEVTNFYNELKED